MNITIISKDGRWYKPNNWMPSIGVLGNLEAAGGRRTLLLKPADYPIEGTRVLLTGKQYIIGRRRYDLESGYALVATLTDKLELVPHLRDTRGREKYILDDGTKPTNTTWPVIQCVP